MCPYKEAILSFTKKLGVPIVLEQLLQKWWIFFWGGIQSEYTIYTSLNVTKIPAWNRCDIWSLNDCNGIRTHNHLLCKRTLNNLVKLAK